MLGYFKNTYRKDATEYCVIFVSLIYIGVQLYRICEFAFDPYWFDYDELQQSAHIYKNLFPDNFHDLSVLNYIDFYTLFGYDLFFSIPSKIILPHELSPFYVVSLTLVFWFGCYQFARHFASQVSSWVFVVFVAHSMSISSSMLGACARGFSYPLFIFFINSYLKKKYSLTVVIMCIMATTYPSIFLISLAFLVAHNLKSLSDVGIFLKINYIKVFFILLCLGFLVNKSHHSPYGKIVHLSKATDMREFYHFSHPMGPGRFDVLPFAEPAQEILHHIRAGLQSSPSHFYHGFYFAYKLVAINMHYYDLFFICYTILIVLPIVYFWKRYSFIWVLLAVSVVLYLLARFFAFRLHFPDRFLIYVLPLWTLFFIPLSFSHWEKIITKKIIKSSLLLSFLVIFFCSYPLFYRIPYSKLNADQVEVVNFIKNIHKDSLVTGIPDLVLDMLPVLSKRESYTTLKAMHPYFSKFYEKMKNRATEAAYLTYAKDPIEIAHFLDNSPVTHLIIDKKDLDRDTPLDLFQPLSEILSKIRNQKTTLYFQSNLSESIILNNTSYLIIDLKYFKKSYDSES